jgi:hypothetical protein
MEEGALKGAFLSRRAAAGEHAPVYWAYQGILALRMLHNLCVEGVLSLDPPMNAGMVVPRIWKVPSELEE